MSEKSDKILNKRKRKYVRYQESGDESDYQDGDANAKAEKEKLGLFCFKKQIKKLTDLI
jgi:hypothetical protein